MLFSLLLVPALVALYFRLRQKRQQAVAALGPLGVVQNSAGRKADKRRHVPPLLFLLGLTLLLLGLARPEMMVALPRVEGTVILAFDVSASMAADDFEPTRIEAAKTAARAFVENQPSTVLIGVVAFSNGGLVVQPPTDNPSAILNAIERLNPEGGTSLGQGIFTSLSAIAGEAISLELPENDEPFAEDGGAGTDIPPIEIDDYPSAVIVLLSDGENTGPPEPLDVAQVAAEAGVRVYPIGIGSPEGAVLEVEGFSVLSQLNESTLQGIASVTNGTYFRAEDEAALQEIYQNIDLQLTIKEETMEVTSIVAGISLVILGIGGALSLLWFGRVP